MSFRRSHPTSFAEGKRPASIAWLIVGLLAAAVSAVWLYGPPRPRPENAPAEAFSAERALRHVQVIAAKPHPRGSAENARVRDYLVAQLQELGLRPEVQRGLATSSQHKVPVPVENVVAIIPGTQPGPAVAVVAHYDSVAVGPGAADNGAAVGAIVETVRALRSQTPRRNAIVVLLTDGEEGGLLGARAFVAENTWKERIGLVLNFDARGTSGSSIMFETSDRNGALIEAFARAVPHKVATSLTNAVYKRMPHGTDFTIFRRAKVSGLNFAFIGGQDHYHRATDSVENLDLGTLQHTGDSMLALLRHFSETPLPLPPRSDDVYFTWLPPLFVHYPSAAVLPHTVALLVAAGFVTYRCFKTGKVSGADLAVAAATLVTTTAVAAGLGWGAFLLRKSVPQGWESWHLPLLVSTLLAAVIAGQALNWLRRRRSEHAHLVAVLGLLTALAVGAAFLLPGGSYLFYWPALLGWGATALATSSGAAARAGRIAVYLAAIATAALIGPTCFLLSEALGRSLPLTAALTVIVCWLVPLRPNRSVREVEPAAVESAALPNS